MRQPRIVGRYALYDEIASGGMGVVHYGRFLGDGFSRTVAIKRLHDTYARDATFVEMFVDEARLAARVRHPNVVPTLDVVTEAGEVFVVMEYVAGQSLSALERATFQRGEEIALPVVSALVCGALHGLHAAHEAKSESGEPLAIVHRDVSPENLLVGEDGVPRLLDFGVAKARGRTHTTRDGQLKGKLRYMAPEQLRGRPVDRRTDVYSAGVVLWEALTQQALFDGESEGEIVTRILERPIEPPSALVASLPRELDAIALRALAREPEERYASAREMALALEACVPIASATRLAAWVHELAAEALAARARIVSEIEKSAAAPPKRRARWLVPAISSAVAASALAVVAAGAPFRARPAPPAAPVAVVTAPAPEPSVTAARIDPPAVPSAPIAPAPTAARRVRRSAPAAAAADASAAKPCTVEWYLDPQGIKHYEKECE